MNIYQRINEIKKEVAYVKKDAAVQGYKAVTHDMVTAATRSAMVKHGVVATQTLIDSSLEVAGNTAKGSPIYLYKAKYLIKFVNIDDPKESVDVTIESHALDHGDKGSGKAMSYAMKYAKLKVFDLETGENEESRIEEFERRKQQVELINNEQVEAIKRLAEKTETDINNLLEFYKVESLEDLNQIQRADIQAKLTKKLNKKEGE